MELKKIEIGAERISVHVANDGSFWAEFDGQRYEEKTLDELKTKLTKVVKASAQRGTIEVSVLGLVPNENKKMSRSLEGPFVEGNGVVQAKLRGKHERQWGVYLLVSDDGQKFQVGGYRRGSGVIVRRLTDNEIARYVALRATAEAAQHALTEFENSVSENVDDLLTKRTKVTA